MSLSNDFVDILNKSHERVWSRFDRVKVHASRYGLDPIKSSKWKSPGEPALAYGVMDWWACQQIEAAISKSFPGIVPGGAVATFYFVHQKPKVEYVNNAGSSVEIELGDLLFIRHHFKSNSVVPEGRAFILQAKANNSPTTGGLSGDEVKQLELYQNWSLGFTFPHGEIAPPRNGLRWDFSKGPQTPAAHSGVYGVVLSERQSITNLAKFNGSCVWGVGFPSATKSLRKNISVPANTMSLGDALSGLIDGRFGRTWVTNPTAVNDHWSEFINNVLRSADLNEANARLQRLGENVPRVQEVLSFSRNIPGLTHLLSKRSLFGSGFVGAKFVSHLASPISLIEKWKSTLDMSGSSAKLPPFLKFEENFSSPRSGMSFIYIVTFGDNSLGEENG